MIEEYWGIYLHGRNYGIDHENLFPYDGAGYDSAVYAALRVEDKYAPAQIVHVTISTSSYYLDEDVWYYRGEAHTTDQARKDRMLDD